MNSSSERSYVDAMNPEMSGPALKIEHRDIQATLNQVRELLHKQKIMEALVARQHAVELS